jgi:hypothetical protein
MRTKKYSSKLMFLGAVILLIVACNMPAPSPQIPANPDGAAASRVHAASRHQPRANVHIPAFYDHSYINVHAPASHAGF